MRAAHVHDGSGAAAAQQQRALYCTLGPCARPHHALQVAVHSKASHLAAADDAGDVQVRRPSRRTHSSKPRCRALAQVAARAPRAPSCFASLGAARPWPQVIDLAAGKVFRAIQAAHSSVATAVAFRPHRPWELLSAGCDMTVAR